MGDRKIEKEKGECRGGEEKERGEGVSSDLPAWFQVFSELQVKTLETLCARKNLLLVNEVLACDEHWTWRDETSKSKKAKRWYARLSNWIKKSWAQPPIDHGGNGQYTEEELEFMT